VVSRSASVVRWSSVGTQRGSTCHLVTLYPWAKALALMTAGWDLARTRSVGLKRSHMLWAVLGRLILQCRPVHFARTRDVRKRTPGR
jgi:hypothetical protein